MEFNNNNISRVSRHRHTKESLFSKWWFWLVSLLILVLVVTSLVLFFHSRSADFTTSGAETTLDEGKEITGKTVNVTVKKVVPNSTYGYNIMAGKHLNFVSSKNPHVKKGDHIIVLVTDVQSMLGAYIIFYKR